MADFEKIVKELKKEGYTHEKAVFEAKKDHCN